MTPAWLEGLGLEEVGDLGFYKHSESGMVIVRNPSIDGEIYTLLTAGNHEEAQIEAGKYGAYVCGMSVDLAERKADALKLAAAIARKWNAAHEEGNDGNSPR